MKIYTEEQVIRLLERYKSDWYRNIAPNEIINLENGIQLPSDDEINILANVNYSHFEKIEGIVYMSYTGFIHGAKKLRDKIKENKSCKLQ